MFHETGPMPADVDVLEQAVLVVDDEADIRESLSDIIQTCLEGVTVHTVSSAEEGLRTLDETSLDLIVTDYRMPGMNGMEFLMEANKRAPQIPKVMITAYPDIDLVVRAINEGHVMNFLPKPFRGEAVVKVVTEALEERRNRLVRRRDLVSALNAMKREKER